MVKTINYTATAKAYLSNIKRIRSSGGATGERSYYPPIVSLLNEVGNVMRPKVFCVNEMSNQRHLMEWSAPLYSRGLVGQNKRFFQ